MVPCEGHTWWQEWGINPDKEFIPSAYKLITQLFICNETLNSSRHSLLVFHFFRIRFLQCHCASKRNFERYHFGITIALFYSLVARDHIKVKGGKGERTEGRKEKRELACCAGVFLWAGEYVSRCLWPSSWIEEGRWRGGE